MNLQGKAAVVTGASRGIGRATAIALASGGCSVLINYSTSKEEAEVVAKELRALNARAICFQANVCDDRACRAMMDTAAQEFGRLDILVNNAGTTRFISFPDLDAVTDADWEGIFATNVKGPFQCVRAARPHMERTGGAIVNVASVAAFAGAGSSIPYCASKAAVINLTLSLARTLGPGIRVNAVAPGFIEGEWLKRGLGADYESARKAKAEHSLLGRVCKPEDIAAAVVSLIAGGDMITGQTIVVDGGHLIGPRVLYGVK